MSHETEYFSFIHLLSSHNGSQSLLINSLTLYLESKKLLHNKGNYKQGEKTAFGVGENNSK